MTFGVGKYQNKGNRKDDNNNPKMSKKTRNVKFLSTNIPNWEKKIYMKQ